MEQFQFETCAYLVVLVNQPLTTDDSHDDNPSSPLEISMGPRDIQDLYITWVSGKAMDSISSESVIQNIKY